MDRVVVSWSGGKDAAMAVRDLRDDPDVEIIELLTTLNETNDRVSMHGVPAGIVHCQAEVLGVPLRTVGIPPDSTNEEYEARMADVLADYEARGVDAMAFADIFLEDVREYRAQRLRDSPIDGLWPLWGRDTGALIEDFLDAGFRTTIACVDRAVLGPEWAGRELDSAAVDALPASVDPCGENGEFHTVVHDGPIFADPISLEPETVVSKSVGDGTYHYCDLRLARGE